MSIADVILMAGPEQPPPMANMPQNWRPGPMGSQEGGQAQPLHRRSNLRGPYRATMTISARCRRAKPRTRHERGVGLRRPGTNGQSRMCLRCPPLSQNALADVARPQASRTSTQTAPAATARMPAASNGLANRGWRRLAGRRFLPVTIARTRSCRFTAA